MPDRAGLNNKTNKKIKTKNKNGLKKGKAPAAPKQEAPNNAAWATQLFQVYNGSASLQYPRIEPGESTEQFILEPALLPLQEGVSVLPDKAQVSAYDTGEREGVVFTAFGGRVEFAVPNLGNAEAEAHLKAMNMIFDHYVMSEITPPPLDFSNWQQVEPEQELIPVQTDETEISAYLSDTVVIEPVNGIRIELGEGEYTKNKNDRNPKLRFGKTRLVFTADNTEKECKAELDETGLHTLEDVDVQLDKQKEDNISATQVVETLNDRREEPEPETPWEWKEFKPGDLTDDKFVEMGEAESEVVSIDRAKGQFGKAKFRFNEIPYTIPFFNKRELKGKTKPKEAGDTMQDFFVDYGGKLYVDFDEPIELSLIGNEKIEQYIVATIVLEGASIKGSRLTAEKIRIDLGVAAKADDDDDDDDNDKKDGSEEESEDEGVVKKLFGKKIHGTFANTSAVNNIDNEGIHAAPGRKSLGAFGVSKFLGFLDVEGDYPTGHLEVGYEKQKDLGMPKLFSETVKNVLGEGVCIPIAGPLSFEISISPSVSVGGSLTAKLDRGKSFGEKMESGESMDLSGEAKIEGKGELDMAAGLAIAPAFISSVKMDLAVGSKLSAGVEVTAQADTALGLSDGKLKQTKDLNLDGGVDIKLAGEVKLYSSVKFFIWDAKLFEVKLYNKEVSIQPFRGQAKRDMNAHGLTQGWDFEAMGLSAKGLGKKTFDAMHDSTGLQQMIEHKLEMSKAAAESLGEKAKSAWAILEELKRQDKLANDHAYLVTEEQRNALKNRIAEMSQEAKDKISQYMQALKDYKTDMIIKQLNTQKEVEKARKNRTECLERDSIRQMAMMNTQKGGFQLENYKSLTPEEGEGKKTKDIQKENEYRNKMAAIDFTVARAIGIFDYKMEAEKDSYDLYARAQNLKLQVDRRQGKNLWQKDMSMSKDMSDEDFLKMNGNEEQLRSTTQFGSYGENYFDILWKEIPYSELDNTLQPILHKKNENAKKGVEKKESIRAYEFLKILVSGVYPKDACTVHGTPVGGKPIPGITPEQKTKLYKKLFSRKLTSKDKEHNQYAKDVGKKNQVKKTEQEYMMDDINTVLQAMFESNLDTMVKTGNINMEEKLKDLDDKLETSRTEYLKAVESKQEVEYAIERIEKEQETCLKKLEDLESNTEDGIKMDSKSVGAAKAAVNFMQNEYMDVANGVTMVKDAVTGVSKESDAYKEMEKLEEEIFPGRKNAMKALKTPVAL